jgi:uncharacterized protein YciU (UPF0263 family)
VPGPYHSDLEIQQALADELTLANGTAALTAANLRIVLEARDWAYNELLTAAAARNLTVQQLDTFKRRREYERAIGLFWAIDKGQFDADIKTELLFKLDRRAELYDPARPWTDELGVPLEPDTDTAVSMIGFGTLSTTNDPIVFNEPGRRNPWE